MEVALIDRNGKIRKMFKMLNQEKYQEKKIGRTVGSMISELCGGLNLRCEYVSHLNRDK